MQLKKLASFTFLSPTKDCLEVHLFSHLHTLLPGHGSVFLISPLAFCEDHAEKKEKIRKS